MNELAPRENAGLFIGVDGGGTGCRDGANVGGAARSASRQNRYCDAALTIDFQNRQTRIES